MLYLFGDSFKSNNKADEVLPLNPPRCSAIHAAPSRCCSHRRLATSSCPRWRPKDQVPSQEKPRVPTHRTPDSAPAIGRGIRASSRADYTPAIYAQITDGARGCGIRRIPKGQPLYAEANGDHKGVNVIGATEILRGYKPCYSIHSSREGIKSQHVGEFVDKLMRANRDKEAWVILDNYRPHRSIAPEYESKYQGRLHFMFLPPYSPELNPQENVWAWLKDYCARDSAYAGDKELTQRIRKFFTYAYNTPSKMRRRVDARVYFGAA